MLTVLSRVANELSIGVVLKHVVAKVDPAEGAMIVVPVTSGVGFPSRRPSSPVKANPREIAVLGCQPPVAISHVTSVPPRLGLDASLLVGVGSDAGSASEHSTAGLGGFAERKGGAGSKAVRAQLVRIGPRMATMGPVVRVELERVEALELLGMTLAHLNVAEGRSDVSPRVPLLMAIRDKLALALQEER